MERILKSNLDMELFEAACRNAEADGVDFDLVVSREVHVNFFDEVWVAVWDTSLEDADPMLTDTDDVAARAASDEQFRTWVMGQFEDGKLTAYLLTSECLMEGTDY